LLLDLLERHLKSTPAIMGLEPIVAGFIDWCRWVFGIRKATCGALR